MDHTSAVQQIREQISYMEQLNADRRRRNPMILTSSRKTDGRGDSFQPLPPHLPRPEYALFAHIVGLDDPELAFYVASQRGNLDYVASYVERLGPSHAARQFALEQACFGNQPAVVRYLLGQGTLLHSNAFVRSVPKPGFTDGLVANILDEGRDPLPLVRVFVESGWHPNQAWVAPSTNRSQVLLGDSRCVTNRPLVTYLLEHGADPNLGGADDEGSPPNRCSGEVLNRAVGQWDPALIDLLLAHGADPAYAHPLHIVAQCCGSMPFPHKPFSQRRLLCEYLLATKAAGVNDVRWVASRRMTASPAGVDMNEEATPFIMACAGEDWEFAKWLLEHGADPHLLGGKALKPQPQGWWIKPYSGPNDPTYAIRLVEDMSKR
ncbi:hypothetical protein GQ53DRAFT_752874 [Thozetella sp. PMI_491]|nr:hypothetical protein GQ53DRAFT_752874 [Thozetella sp. PMI_491]